jgi:HAD superfamily hydrolase (TIGR01509 family)
VDTEKVFEETFGLDKLPKKKRALYEAVTHRTERGEEPTERLLNVIRKIFKLPIPITEINEMLVSSVLIKPMWNLLQSLRKNYKVGILTNNQKYWPEEIAKHVGISFEGIKVFNSAEIGVRKPMKEIYVYVLKHLKNKPNEVLFIDDKAANIKTAEELGFNTIHFTGNIKDVLEQLKSYGVKVTIE